MYAQVRLTEIPYHLDRAFGYLVPPGLDVRVGSLVTVPFGRSDRRLSGVVVACSDMPPADAVQPLKQIAAVYPEMFSLDDNMMALARFLSTHNLCTLGCAIRAILPPGAFSGHVDQVSVSLYRRLRTPEEIEACLAGKTVRGTVQKAVLSFFLTHEEADAGLIADSTRAGKAQLTALVEKGWLSVRKEPIYRTHYHAGPQQPSPPPVLSSAQQEAADTLRGLLGSGRACAALLYGVTGSGKTKVILDTIDRALECGRGVIMMVPEIALTPQTVSIFLGRYGDRVAVMHSGLSAGERLDAWRRIRSGEIRLVVGTRSAVLVPMENIGLIVLDEEHEHTYKSESDPKYHAREVASFLCGRDRALLLLASATPSLESFYKAEQKIYTLVPLRERYGGAVLPETEIVDLRQELRHGNLSPLSDRLYELLSEKRRQGEQSILFLNRRGYSTALQCRACGEPVLCPRCSVSLTYHAAGGSRLLCHACGYAAPVPRVCPSCGADHLSYVGFGTQKVEGELARQLSDARVLRMDADTTGRRDAYDRLLDRFRNGEADVLLGTQMVAKGHDFPHVTLVGVLLADASLYVNDFRAAERTFSLLTQVVGRAGRGEQRGIAVIQTYSPDHAVIRLAAAQDYEAFYRGEIAVRKSTQFPPFCDLVQLTLHARKEEVLKEAGESLYTRLCELSRTEYADLPLTVFGPFAAQIYKINEVFRLRTVIKCRLSVRMRALLDCLMREFAVQKDLSLTVDLNPMSL